MARRHIGIICPRCGESGGTVTQRKAGNAKSIKYFYIKHFDHNAKHKCRWCYIGRSHMLAYITIPDERYSLYEKNIGRWSIRNREVNITENLDLIRRALDLLVDMGFPERFTVQKFVADMARLMKDYGVGYQLHEKHRFSLFNFKAFTKRFSELYKGGAEIKRLDEFKKSYFDRI